jgi:hypothetical protein
LLARARRPRAKRKRFVRIGPKCEGSPKIALLASAVMGCIVSGAIVIIKLSCYCELFLFAYLKLAQCIAREIVKDNYYLYGKTTK